jgi:hypothetical protein
MNTSTILLVFFLGGIILAAGCTVPLSSGVPIPETTLPAGTPAADVKNTPLSPAPASTTFWPERPVVGEFTTVPTTRPASDNPHLDYLNIRKRTFENPLPDCLMEHAFPAIAADPDYGIEQLVPKLAAISEDEYESFRQKYTEGDARNTQLKVPAVCQNTDNEPTWNFIEVRIVLTPTNFFPSDYTITQNVRSGGEVVARFATTKRLVIDEQLVLVSYAPLHADEVHLFDRVELTYPRH